MFFLSDNFRPGIHAEQSTHAQEQAQVAATPSPEVGASGDTFTYHSPSHSLPFLRL